MSQFMNTRIGCIYPLFCVFDKENIDLGETTDAGTSVKVDFV